MKTTEHSNMNSDNPASRLYEILKVAKSLNTHSSQREVWQEALFMTNCTDSQLLAQLGKVMALPEEIHLWLEETFPTKKWITWKESLDNAFASIYLNGKWELSANHINDRALTELDIISTLYGTAGGIKSISNEEIDKFTDKIQEIKEEVIGSSMPVEMKKTFLRYLNKILGALESYHITGAIPIMEAVESAMGHVVVDSNYADSLKKTGAGEQLITFLGSLIDAVASVQGLPPMATPLLQFIKPKE